MSGGSGTRLWPMSRAARPKQFLPLTGEMTLFQQTALRFAGAGDVEFLPPVVITGATHADLVAAQLDEIGIAPADIIVEPSARNTAAVAAIAAAWTAKSRPGALTLLTPADHHISDDAAFRAGIAKGAAAAAKGAIVTFGIIPTEAHTGYGYIEAGAPIANGVSEVGAFREKPDRLTAEHYIASGRHFWNAGVFLYAPETMIAELSAFAPAIAQSAVSAFNSASIDGAACRLDPQILEKCPSESIDCAVMEKTARAAVVHPIDAGWSDIGAWTAIAPGEDARIAEIDCADVIIKTDGPFVGAIGVSDLVIVATKDAILVAPKSRAQDVRKIVDELKRRGREDLL